MLNCHNPPRCRVLVLSGLLTIACAPRGPVLDTGSRPANVGGTIAGTVRADGGAVSLAGRRVTATNQTTGAHFDATSGTDGGYTINVPTGTYRLEVELRPGETVAKSPDPTEVNRGDLDPNRNFLLAVAR